MASIRPKINNLDAVEKIIERQEFLFRGTNEVRFNERTKEQGYYGYLNDEQKLVTTATPYIIEAIRRATRQREETRKEMRPLLVAIHATPYIKQTYPGMDFYRIYAREIEIFGKIQMDHVTIIDSLEKLQEFAVRTSKAQPGNDFHKVKQYFSKLL